MSLQWTFVATFLYTEVFLVALLLLPFISAYRWQRIFRSKLLSAFHAYANLYFNIFIVVLVLLFIDAARDARKYMTLHNTTDLTHALESARTVNDLKMFRAQRNLYIAGFALFLFLVMRRLVTLLSTTASLEANIEASQKQAESATAVAKKLMEEKENKDNEKEEKDASAATDSVKKLEQLTKQYEKSQNDLKRTALDLDTMRKQANSTNTEYDRLLEEHASLQEKVKALEGNSDKKDD